MISDTAQIRDSSTITVFTGPSVSPEEMRTWLPRALILPPIARGDLYRARERGGRVFLIVDGLFSHRLAVSPREIIDVLQDGAMLVGCSSMGAVRASECWPVGMRGVGVIYRLYRAGVLETDDEVAVATDPDRSFAATSVPLINVRYAASKAAKRGLVDRAHARRIVEAAQSIFFADRQWRSIFDKANICDRRVRDFCRLIDLKKNDAISAANLLSGAGNYENVTATRRTSFLGTPMGDTTRYPGHDRYFGRDIESLQVELLAWLFGSGRYQRFIWSLVAGEPELIDLPAANDQRPEALRQRLAQVMARLFEQPGTFAGRVWHELDFLDELDAELIRWYAVHECAAAAEIQDLDPSEEVRQRVRDETAILHGCRNWKTMQAYVSNGLLFDAIPIEWVTRSCVLLTMAQRFSERRVGKSALK